jgi:hypothetical protein
MAIKKDMAERYTEINRDGYKVSKPHNPRDLLAFTVMQIKILWIGYFLQQIIVFSTQMYCILFFFQTRDL